jgi:Peptidase inhibitor I78 family
MPLNPADEGFSMRVRTLLLSSLLVASCLAVACGSAHRIGTPPSSVPPPPASASCDAAKAEFAVGQPASDDLLERARVAARAGSARFLRPNQPITMEFSPSRLNLNLDSRGVVLSANCG